jgi:hypothetical protein
MDLVHTRNFGQLRVCRDESGRCRRGPGPPFRPIASGIPPTQDHETDLEEIIELSHTRASAFASDQVRQCWYFPSGPMLDRAMLRKPETSARRRTIWRRTKTIFHDFQPLVLSRSEMEPWAMSSIPIRAVLAVFALYPALAWAQPAPSADSTMPPPPDVQRLLGYQASQPAAAGPVCTKLCAADMSPCDPIYMKEADGRCDGITSDMNF